MVLPVAAQPFKRFLLTLTAVLGCYPGAAVVYAADDASSARAWRRGGQVARLDDAIERYGALAAAGGWEPVPPGPELVAGMRHPDVRRIRQRLRLTQDFSGEVSADPILFDLNLTRALMRFQARHGLEVTGIVDRLTREVLSEPVEQRLAELRYARAAWSGLDPVSSGRTVWVNIPEARVTALQDDDELSFRAIVGKLDRPTPILSSDIRRVVINPPWRVPRSIAVADLLPRQQRDPEFLSRQGISVYRSGARQQPVDPGSIDWSSLSDERFPYQLVQAPGPGNALGAYKFDFANDYDVYLHDTPAPQLLDLSFRSFSSGCVRVDDSDVFAAWLLQDEARSETRDRRSTRYELLDEPVALHIVYLPAWVAADGQVQFRRDIYGYAGSGVPTD